MFQLTRKILPSISVDSLSKFHNFTILFVVFSQEMTTEKGFKSNVFFLPTISSVVEIYRKDDFEKKTRKKNTQGCLE